MSKYYQKKSRTVEALLYKDNLDEVIKFISKEILYKPVDKRIVIVGDDIDTPAVHLAHGEYVLRDKDGNFETEIAEKFEDIYELIDGDRVYVEEDIDDENRGVVIFLYDPTTDKILTQLKHRGPFPYKRNGIGGKCKVGEPFTQAAFRELEEETGLTDNDLVEDLYHLTTMEQPSGYKLGIYYGIVEEDSNWYQLTDERLLYISVSALKEDLANENISDLPLIIELIESHIKLKEFYQVSQ